MNRNQERELGQEIYDKYKSLPLKERSSYKATLSDMEKLLLKRTTDRINKANSMKDPKIREAHNKRNQESMQKIRANDPDHNRELNIKHQKTYRDTIKQKKDAIASASAEIEKKLKAEAEAKEVAANILNDIIDSIPQTIKRRNNLIAVKKYQAKKKQGGDIRVYTKKK